MAQNKSNEFHKKHRDIADLAKAISHPARVQILKALAKKGDCMCGEMVEVLPLAQSTVSQHLKALKESGLIDGTISGTSSCYCINVKAWTEFKKSFDEFSDFIIEKSKNNTCC